MIKRFATVALAAAVVAGGLSVGRVAVAQDKKTIAEMVVDLAGGNPAEFTALLGAVQAADPTVLEMLSDPKATLTVFAPTDAAFAALAENLGAEAFGAIVADPEQITEILAFHVVTSVVKSADVVAGLEATGFTQVKTALGQHLDVVAQEDGSITVDGAVLNLEMIDIEAANGVIHVIDAVMVPESRTIAEIVVASTEAETPEFTTLLAAVAAADPAVLETLSDPEATLTVFAPTDAAFAALVEALGQEAFDAILADPAALTGILLYHTLPMTAGYVDVAALLEANAGEIMVDTNLEGKQLTIKVVDGVVMINDAKLVLTNIDAANGIIHVIDAVLVPAE
jgi:transforming growth factor-beta-induced protein